ALVELPAHQQEPAVPEHDQDTERDCRLQNRSQRTAQAREAQALVQVLLVRLLELGLLGLLERERAYDAHARDARLHARAHAPESVLVVARARIEALREAARDQEH